MAHVTITERDNGFAKLWSELERAAGRKRTFVQVGIQSDAGTNNDGLSLVQVGVWNEFGTNKIPSRPFIRQTYDQQKQKLGVMLQRGLTRLVKDPDSTTIKKILDQVGATLVADIQLAVAQRGFAANADSTIKAKGSDTPLKNWGTLISSVTWKTTIKNKGGPK